MALCITLFSVYRHLREETTLNSNVYSHLATYMRQLKSQTDDAMFYCDAIKNARRQTL